MDFNIVKDQEEKLRGLVFVTASSQFVEFMEELGLVDLLMNGGALTWCNNKEEATFCYLDIFLVAS